MTRKQLTFLLVPSLLLFAMVAMSFSGTAPARADDATATPTATSTATPTPSPTPGPIAVSITPGQRVLTCGGSTPVTINVTRSGAAIPDGTAVQLQVSSGVLLPSVTANAVGNTTAGNAVFTYSAPVGGTGIVNLTATSLGVMQTAQINLFCGLASTQPATLGQPTVTCAGGSASVVFNWTPITGGTTQYLDLTLANNGFAPGTFIGAGPLDPTLASLGWNGLIAGQTHYWRINTLSANGWLTSTTGSFTPCAVQLNAGQVTYSCSGGRANVSFGLGTLPAGSIANWLDLTVFDNGFQPGTYIGSYVLGMTQYTWQGILPNVQHFWRVNTLTAAGWSQTLAGSFVATC